VELKRARFLVLTVALLEDVTVVSQTAEAVAYEHEPKTARERVCDSPTGNRLRIGCSGEALPAPVSVIIPARNAASTIAATLRSLVPDGNLIREIVLVDDGSIDDTAAVASAVAHELDLPLIMLRAEFCSSGAARNLGIRRAQGDFIYFLDADDEVLPGGLRLLVQCLTRDDGVDLAVGGHLVRVSGAPDKFRSPVGCRSEHRANVRNYLTNRLGPIPMGSALVTRRAAGMASFPETVVYDEDTLFWATVLLRADVRTEPHRIFVYNRDQERMTRRFTSAPRRHYLQASRELDRLAKAGADEGALRWRKGWIAVGTARALVRRGDFVAAIEFLRAAVASHPRIRWSARTLRCFIRIRIGMSAQRFVLWKSRRLSEARAG